jgi:thiamine biosynthesis lipoprotein ApbE/S1-C subfamily serine protease
MLAARSVFGWLLLAVTTCRADGPALQKHEFRETHMGAEVKLVLYTIDDATARRASRAAFDRVGALDKTLSDYDPESELMRLCDRAGGPPVPVSADLFEVLERSQEMSRRSGGAFDITVGPVVRLWRRARRQRKLPDPELLAKARELVDYRNVVLDRATRSVRLIRTGMKLDLGGIAKGHAASEAIAVLKKQGVQRALAALAGDIAVGEPPPGEADWSIGIAALENPDGPPARYLHLANAAVSTAGDTERFVEIGGVRYSHIVDPETGVGVVERASVTVVAPDGATADSLDTAAYILGRERGLALIERTPESAGLIQRREGQTVRTYESKRMRNHLVPRDAPRNGSDSGCNLGTPAYNALRGLRIGSTERRIREEGSAMPLACTAAFVALSVCCAAAPVAGPEVLELKDGHRIVGEIVADKQNAYYVDLGFDVIKVPKDQVVDRHKPDQAGKTDQPTPGVADADPKGFYSVTSLKLRPVKELVHQYGEAVISVETPSGLGSGFIVNVDGYAVTNNHVIEGETRISAVLYENTASGLARRRIENVEIVALNPFVDLALLKLTPPKDLKLAHVALGSLDEMNAGDGVFAVGNPLGLERSVSQGILSTLNRNFQGLIYLQTDAAINPGNSGGPLFNLKGEVVGVTNMKASFGDNLGFAIPINYVKDFLRNRDAFSYDKDNPNTGYRYVDPPRRLRPGGPSRRISSGGGTESSK